MIGYTSVTFRKEPIERIVELAARAGLDGIEWGGDVHVPPGDIDTALRARELTAKAGLKVLSYGSYYRLCEDGEPSQRFLPVLESAAALGAPAIRIWAGSLSPAEASPGDYRRAAEELGVICAMAAERNIFVCFEYHPNTLTETCESAVKLLETAGSPNLKTYWQPNPDITHAENIRELIAVLPWLHTVHTFHLSGGNTRHALETGRVQWLEIIGIAKSANPNYVLEFVANDSPDALMADAAALRGFCNAT